MSLLLEMQLLIFYHSIIAIHSFHVKVLFIVKVAYLSPILTTNLVFFPASSFKFWCVVRTKLFFSVVRFILISAQGILWALPTFPFWKVVHILFRRVFSRRKSKSYWLLQSDFSRPIVGVPFCPKKKSVRNLLEIIFNII